MRAIVAEKRFHRIAAKAIGATCACSGITGYSAAMMDGLWQAFFQVTGGVNALLLGAVLLFSPRLNRTRARQKLGLALLVYGYLLFSFTAVDNLWISPSWWILLSDYVLVLLAAALFLDYMSGSLGRGSISILFYLPPVLFIVIAPLVGPAFIAGPAINIVILVQVAYTCLTNWTFIRSRRYLSTRTHHLQALLIGLWILHAFQVSRMLLPGIGWLFDMVPLVGAGLVLTFTVLVLTDSRTMRALSQVVPKAGPQSITQQDLDLYMKTEKPYLDSRMSLDQLARAMAVPARQLSQLIGGSAAGNFYNFVNHYRVEEARRLLADPRERRTSIEAIAMMSGFRARSTFYEAFRREQGQTPAQFRTDVQKPGR